MWVRVLIEPEMIECEVQAYRNVKTVRSVLLFLRTMVGFGVGMALIGYLMSLFLPVSLIIPLFFLIYIILFGLAWIGNFYGLHINCPRCSRSLVIYRSLKRCPFCGLKFTLDYDRL